MNERILELARQVWPDPNISHVNHMKFAELLVRECIGVIGENNYGMLTGRAYCTQLKRHFGIDQ